jgi:hypothetical protein
MRDFLRRSKLLRSIRPSTYLFVAASAAGLVLLFDAAAILVEHWPVEWSDCFSAIVTAFMLCFGLYLRHKENRIQSRSSSPVINKPS